MKTNGFERLAACSLESVDVILLETLGTLGALAAISPSYLLLGVLWKNFDPGQDRFDANTGLSPF
jgi:hypothetical protein